MRNKTRVRVLSLAKEPSDGFDCLLVLNESKFTEKWLFRILNIGVSGVHLEMYDRDLGK